MMHHYFMPIAPLFDDRIQEEQHTLAECMRIEICGNPDDMSPRKQYADFLMESGDDLDRERGEMMQFWLEHPEGYIEILAPKDKGGMVKYAVHNLDANAEAEVERHIMPSVRDFCALCNGDVYGIQSAVLQRGWIESISIKDPIVNTYSLDLLANFPIRRYYCKSYEPYRVEESALGICQWGSDACRKNYFLREFGPGGVLAKACLPSEIYDELDGHEPNISVTSDGRQSLLYPARTYFTLAAALLAQAEARVKMLRKLCLQEKWHPIHKCKTDAKIQPMRTTERSNHDE